MNSSALVLHSSYGGGHDGRIVAIIVRFIVIEANYRNKARDQSKLANIAQVTNPAPPEDVTISATEYYDFLQFRAAQQLALLVTSVPHSNNPIAFVS